MKNFTHKLDAELSARIEFIAYQGGPVINQSGQCLDEVNAAMKKLRNFTVKYNFKNDTEEINFFKKEKPKFLSRLIYYNEIFQLESRKPSGGKTIQMNYYKNALKRLSRFTNYHLDFYKYYRGNLNYYDTLYFLRGKLDLKIATSTKLSQFDPKFATNHDYTVAKIIANDMMELYLTEQLEKISMQLPPQPVLPPTMNWTESKTALTELIYALHFVGAVEGGSLELKEIVTVFEKMFAIDLGDIYRTYSDIKIRSNPAKFLDQLKVSLLARINSENF